MNRNIWVVILILVVGFSSALVLSHRHFDRVNSAHEQQLDAARLKNDYLERVGWIRAIPDEKTYKQEVTSFFKWYAGEVDAHVKKFGLSPQFDEYLKELDKRAGKDVAKVDADKKGTPIADRRAAYDWEKKTFDLFRSGKYAPLWSASDQDMRLDVVSDEVTVVDGKPKVRLSLVIWGAQRERYDDETREVHRVKTNLDMTANFKLFDDKGKLFGEMNTGNPAMRNDFPERLISLFPPQLVLAYYDLEKVPSNIDKVEITFTAHSRAPTGGDAQANWVWKLSPPPTWKLAPGTVWEGATETTRTAEEIDPAGAKKKQARK